MPGTYTVTFALSGFVTVRREGVAVSSGQSITISADLRVGGVQETITVTGETPVVDVQTSTRTQKIIDNEVVAVLPASRGYGNILATVPGIQATGLNSGANPVMNFFTARGGRGNEGTIQIDGMNVGSAFNGGGVAGFGYDTANATEIQVTIAGGLGETDRGGPAFNMIPRTGGNNFSGTYFLSYAGEWAQASNLDAELKSFGINEVPGLDQELGHQLRAGRADQARSAVVLRQRAELRIRERRPGPLWQRERRKPERVHLRRGPQPQSPQRQLQVDWRDPVDGSGDAQEQAGLLLRLPEELLGLGVHRRR